MATSQTGICNIALTFIGQTLISDIDEQSNNAQRCSILWDSVRQSILNDHNWNFATKISPLGLLSESVPGWGLTYSYPSDCLFIQKVFNDSTPNYLGSSAYPQGPSISANNALKNQAYRSLQSSLGNGRIIVTNVEQAYIQYVWDVTDVSQFDSSFIDAFCYLLASKLAQSITGNKDLAATMTQYYQRTVDEAKASNMAENNLNQNYIESDYINAR
jgi:hypothetical protein